MTESVMSGAQYKSADTIQGAFKYNSHENISVSAVDSASLVQKESVVLLSASDYFYMEVNGTATTSSMLLPPGITAFIVENGDVLHFIQVAAASIVSIINPK